MTYARARLWLGMSGVGLIVVLSLLSLFSQMQPGFLPTSQTWSSGDIKGLTLLFGCLAGLLFPLDVLGGYVLPKSWQLNTPSWWRFFRSWVRGTGAQGILFIGAGCLILQMGRSLGLPGAVLAVGAIASALVIGQLQIAKLVGSLPTTTTGSEDFPNIQQAESIVASWGWKPRPITVLEHQDTGFTGGIVGVPGMETIVLPASLPLELSPDQLAIVIARRMEAIQGGSRTRGITLALLWVILGFTLSAMVPGAGVTSVAELSLTCMGFTVWTFVGLLTLPTLSRQAAHAIDGKVLRAGAPTEVFKRTVKKLDTFQDDEPQRPNLVEAIFHPVPSVENRGVENRGVENRSDENNGVISAESTPIAWHAARITLFLSWACMGTLVRAVHCNVGRPELWVMLPTD